MGRMKWEKLMDKKPKNVAVERINAAFSMTVNDRNRLRELAILNETSQSALLGRWIKEHYKEEIENQQQN